MELAPVLGLTPYIVDLVETGLENNRTKLDNLDVREANNNATQALLISQLNSSNTSFDGRGNYAMGIKEQLIYPEINYDKVETIRGMDIIFVTTAQTDEEAHALLEALGMPFAKA